MSARCSAEPAKGCLSGFSMKKGLFALLLIGFSMRGELFAQKLRILGVPTQLSDAINSPFEESSPFLAPYQEVLYITRFDVPKKRRQATNNAAIWYARRTEKGWEEAKLLALSKNLERNRHLLGFTFSGVMYFAQDKGIFRSHRTEMGWSAPTAVEMPGLLHTSAHPSGQIALDGRVLLLGIDRFSSGQGGEDLYVTVKNEEKGWSVPKNLGITINTPYRECAPFLLADRRTLIFASNGRDGYGSLDLYQSHRLDSSWTRWSEPKNLGNVINTAGAESFFSLSNNDPSVAYFVRAENSDGYGNIWQVKVSFAKDQARYREDSAAHLRLSLYEKASNEPLKGGFLRIIGITADIDTTLQLSSTNEAVFNVKKVGTHTLTFIVPGYLPLSQPIECLRGEVTARLFFVPIKTGAVLISNVPFRRGTSDFLPNAMETLQKIVILLQENLEIGLFISGHTDNQGNFEDNFALSKRRVQAVVQYLIEKGIDKARLSGKGFGSARPLSSNQNEKSRARNRRVEFTIQKLEK